MDKHKDMNKWIRNIVKNGNDDSQSSGRLIEHFGELIDKFTKTQNDLK